MTDRTIAPLTEAEAVDFVAAARTWAGTPFRHRGRTERGVDCLGLVVVAMAQVGRTMSDRPSYGRDPTGDLGAMRAAARAHFGPPVFHKGQSLDLLRPGDVVLMQWHQEPNHVAIVTDNPNGLGLIHAVSGKVVVEHSLAGPWPRRILEGFRP